MKKCNVINRPLTVNGRTLAPGTEISLAEEDAALLIARERLADAGDSEHVHEPETEPEQEPAPAGDQDHEPAAATEEPEQKTEGSE